MFSIKMVVLSDNHKYKGFLLDCPIMGTKKSKQEKDEFFLKLGKHIKKVRKEKELSIRELEMNYDIDRHLLSKWESASKYPNLYSIKKLCDAMNISLEEFFKGMK